MEFDYVIIGSGFGGSVGALRLSEKGYKVLVIEKGKWFKAEDFPKNNTEVKKWIWEPKLKMKGFFKMTFLNHVTALSGVGVGGGSLTYANTLPVPKKEFFNSGSWGKLNNWEQILAPFYASAYSMLGASVNPILFEADKALQNIAKEIGIENQFEATKVAVYFGEPGVKVKDPYFSGKGPDRSGCTFCGACMTGCRFNSKNTLDKNYLHLAQQLGAQISAEKEVFDVIPIDNLNGEDGYTIHYKSSFNKREKYTVTTKAIIFAGGVLGTVPLLLKLKQKSLPKLSEMVGCNVRTNNESLLGVTSINKNATNYNKGIAIGSILHADKNSHLEVVRYGDDSHFFRLLTVPFVYSKYALFRFFGIFGLFFVKPIMLFKTIFAKNYAKRSTILLFMQTLDSTLRLKLGTITKLKSVKEQGKAPTAFIKEAQELAKKFAKQVNGIPYANFTDVLFGIPTTAHILGGAVMAEDNSKGVIDKNCNVFGYKNMMVCDGSIISANPGVNPSLTITAITEYAMSNIPIKNTKI
ncbi:GMC oxidoreductase [Lutibacter sp.]|uniref:GMC oxidoreductase n=1 Tax=Lutibacter sp. TaxID=1925666 RepID=UPI002733C4ED|nr:GMC oxidoreductase [Lutibacter sp.]MDP3312214.1 GMC oxidoreductase [Lutibacter sp.]